MSAFRFGPISRVTRPSICHLARSVFLFFQKETPDPSGPFRGPVWGPDLAGPRPRICQKPGSGLAVFGRGPRTGGPGFGLVLRHGGRKRKCPLFVLARFRG